MKCLECFFLTVIRATNSSQSTTYSSQVSKPPSSSSGIGAGTSFSLPRPSTMTLTCSRTWKSININNCGTGVSLLNDDNKPNTGSIYLVDTVITDTPVGIRAYMTGTALGTPAITLDNVVLQNVNTAAIVDSNNNVVLAGGSTGINFYSLGRVYKDGEPGGVLEGNMYDVGTRPDGLTVASSGWPQHPYFSRSKPQYEGYGVDAFEDMKYLGLGTRLPVECLQRLTPPYSRRWCQ